MEKETTIKKEKSPLWKRVENFAESQPRKAFYIMFGFNSVLNKKNKKELE